jgi:hypothetical protein
MKQDYIYLTTLNKKPLRLEVKINPIKMWII